MIERLSTGDARLDEVLGGGFVANAITLVAGEPGTGKTILAEQCLFKNASPERPALYCSTVSEPFDKLLRYGQSLGFFDPKAIGHSVFYDDLGGVLNEHGVPVATSGETVADGLRFLGFLPRPSQFGYAAKRSRCMAKQIANDLR